MDKKHDKQTVFVRGVSFDTTDQELEEFFADIGPVRQAFLVKTKGGQKPHKGFGFVHFALQSDAERAATELNGKELGGRRIQVEVAIKRAPLEERKKKRKEQAAEDDAAAGATAGAAAAEAPAVAEPAAAAAPKEGRPAKKAKAGAGAAVEAPAAPKPSVAPAPAPAKAGADKAAGASAEKHRLVRTVAVGRLTPETVNAAIKLAQAAGEVEEIISPAPQPVVDQYKLERDGCSGHAFLAVYTNIKAALTAVTKLHGMPVGPGAPAGQQGKEGRKKGKGKKGAAAAAEEEEGEEAAAAGVVAWARQVSGEGLHLKRWRLIVRNLPFNVTEAQLRSAFEPAGFVWELTLPRSPDGKARGFAFVGYTCRAHAEKGIRDVNGTVVAGRPVAVDWALSKAQFDAAAKQQLAPGGEAVEGKKKKREQTAEEKAGLDSDSDSEGGPGHRPGYESEGEAEAGELAPEQEHAMLSSVIDGILGGSSGKGKQKTAAEGGEGEESEGGSEVEDGSEGDEDSEEDEHSEEEEEEQGGGDGDMFSKRALQQRAAAQAAALERLDRKLQAKPLGKAVAEQEAAAAAAAAAKEGGAATGGEGGEGKAAAAGGRQPREGGGVEAGATVFIRGLPLDVTKQQLQSKLQAYGRVASCRLVVDKNSGRLKGTAFVDFADAASAQKAAEACAKARRKEGPGVVVAGRAVDVDLALGQEELRSLAAQKAGERGPKDRRNLYLAKEGVIPEGSPAWEEMSVQDRNKRKRAAVEKKTKLASPNFLVSTTRLSVRNIPASWTEKQLKQLFTQAVIERASKAKPHVRQAKILVDDSGAGAPKSKGIGFVEFDDHEHALCALRQLNNNPKAWGKERRPIVEFAIENAKILKAREAKLERMKRQQQQQQGQGEGEGEGGAQGQQQQQGEEGGRPAKRARGEKGGQQQAASGEGGAAEAAAAGEGGEAVQDQQEAPQQQSKRQRRREIKLKLRQIKQQQVQERAAAAAAGAKAQAQGAVGGAAAAKEHSRAKKRRELRKAKKLGPAGAAASAAAAAAAAPAAPAKLQQAGKPQQAAKQPPPQQTLGVPKGRPGQKQGQREGLVGRGRPQQGAQQKGGTGQAAARPGPKANSKVAKGAQQAQREQQAQQRKRRADEALDSLVGGMTGGPKQAKKQANKPKPKGEDRLDKLAAEYKAKFFGGGSSSKGAKAGGGKPAPVQLGLKRWFE